MNYQLNESKMYADVTEGIAIIINSETGIYYGLNGFATCIYENLQNGAAVEEIAAAVSAMPGAPEDFGSILDEFIQALVSQEILEAAPESSAAVEIGADVAGQDSFKPVCQAFEDAQELLLADPIHEVREDEGWSPMLDSLNEDKEDVAKRESKMGF